MRCELALALGKFLWEVDELPESEFTTWMQYFINQPQGSWREDFRAGLIASTVANTVSKKAYSPSDFMPFYHAPKSSPKKVNIGELFGDNVY